MGKLTTRTCLSMHLVLPITCMYCLCVEAIFRTIWICILRGQEQATGFCLTCKAVHCIMAIQNVQSVWVVFSIRKCIMKGQGLPFENVSNKPVNAQLYDKQEYFWCMVANIQYIRMGMQSWAPFLICYMQFMHMFMTIKNIFAYIVNI